MADIRLAKPAAGTSQKVVCTPDARFVFEFPTDEATLSRNGDNLVITFEDGSTLQLENFYTAYSSENMPSFSVDGAEISGEDFFTAMNEPDLMPAAGPAGNAGNQSNGNRFHDYVNADLLDGLDRLGGLDIGWPGSDVNPETDGAATSGDYVDIDYGVTVTPGDPGIDDTPVIDNPDNPNDNPPAGVVADRDVLRVQESNLAGGTNPNEAALSADGFMNIDAPDGVASITIGSVIVFENGALTGTPVPTDEGYLDVTGFDPATGRLDYTYHLTGSTQEHEKDTAADDSIAHELPVTVTDTDGSTGSGVITVVIEDDVPTLSVTDQIGEVESGATSDTVTGQISYDFGADDGEGKSFTITTTKDGEPVTVNYPVDGGSVTVTSDHGTLTVNADGSYSYKANPNTEGKDSFTFTITDADGDSAAEQTIDVTVTKAEGPVIDDTNGVITVDEEGLADGTNPDAASETAQWTAPEGYTIESIKTQGSYGTSTIKDGKLEYTLGDALQHTGEGQTETWNGADTVTVILRDANGNTFEVEVQVNVKDDVPTLDVTDFSGAYGEDITGTVDFDFGADRGEGAKIELSVNGGDKVEGVSEDDGKTWTFDVDGQTVTLDAETGKFHYDLSASGSDATYTFQFTVTDADDDVVSNAAPVEVKVEGTDLAGVKGSVTGDDDNVLTDAVVDVDIPTDQLEALGATLKPNQTVNVVDTDGKVYGQLIVDAEGNVTFKQTEAYSGEQHGIQGESEKATGFSGKLEVTLDDGTTSTITVDVSILDDVPTLTLTDANTEAQYGQSIVIGTLTSNYGADGANTESSLELSINGTQGVLSDGVYTFAGIGTATIGADGRISFQPESTSGKQQDYTLSVTIRDADDDTATDNFTFSVEGTDLSEVKGSVTGDDDNVLTDAVVDVDIPTDQLEALGATLKPNQTVNVVDTDGKVYGQLIVDAEGNVTFKQTEAYSGEQHGIQGESEKATGFSGKLEVTLDDGTTSTITVDVSILDDVPTVSSMDADNDGKPDITFTKYPEMSEDGYTPLGNGKSAVFTDYTYTVKKLENGEVIKVVDTYEDKPIWNDEVIIKGATVEYTYSNKEGEEGKHIVTDVKITGNQELSYSSHIINDNIADDEKIQNVGLAVGDHHEILADRGGNTSDAIIVELPEGKLAYGLNLKLGAFFTESESSSGSQWDNVAEKALLTFYKGDDPVLIYPIEAESEDGTYVVPSDLVITEGFDKVIISAVDNSWVDGAIPNVDQSDFVVQEIGFITLPPNQVMFRYEGDLVSDGGADGFADGYRFAFSDQMGDSLLVKLDDGTEVTATLTRTEGDNGSSILLATIPAGADGKTENLFSVTLDTDGHWKFDQYQEFSMPDGKDFELGFMTKDNDGDTAYEEVTLITTTETNIGTDGDHVPTSSADVIVDGNSGHDNFVGDPGGATESTQTTYTDLNVALVVDTSGSMAGTRMSETKEALKGLCGQLKEHADKGADVNISLIGFSSDLNINLSVEDITGTEANYRKFTVHSVFSTTTIIGKVGTEFSVSNGYYTTTYRITEDGTLQKSSWLGGGSWENVRTSSTESLTGYEAVLAQIDAMQAIGDTNYSAGYGAAKDWFGNRSNPDSLQNNGGENIVIFVTDGEPNRGDTNKSYNQLVGAVDGITVETIGIAITDKDATDLLNGLTTNNNGAHFIADASELGNVFGEIVSDITTSTVTPAADDIILGGRGNDMLFGDAPNADYLLGEEYDWVGKDTYVKGSSWDIINAYLVATLGYDPSEGEIARFITQNADKLGLTDTVADSAGVVRGGDDTILGGSGDDIVYGQGGNDLLFGDGSDTAGSASSIGTLNTLDTLLTAAGADTVGSYVERIHELGTQGSQEQPSELDRFISSLEADGGIEKDTDGNDMLYGGEGDDMLFGGGGNDYLDGGDGSDYIFAGSGDDIVVYDSSDYLIDGGDGIDVLLADINDLQGRTPEELLTDDNSTKPDNGPIVNGFEIVITGENIGDLGLTSLSDFGITIGNNNRVTLDEHWQNNDGTITGFFKDTSGHEVTLTMHVDNSIQDMVDQAAQNIANSNG